MNEPIPSDTEALRAALAAEQQARREAEARASGAEAMVAHLKLLIAKMKRDRFGASAPGELVMHEYGYTVENVCKRAIELVNRHRRRNS